MAVFIPSQVDSTMRSLSSWNQAQTRDKQMAIAQSQAQLQELARLGIRDSRVDDATKRLMGGGALFGSLRPGAQMDVPGLTSAQAQTGQNAQARDYSGQKNLDIAQKKSSALVGQERLEQLRGERDLAEKRQMEAVGKEFDLGLGAPSSLADKIMSSAMAGVNDTSLAERDANNEIIKQNVINSEFELDRLNYQIEGESEKTKQDLKDLQKLGVNVSDKQIAKTTDTGLSLQDSRRTITRGSDDYLNSQKKVEALEKDKSSFLKNETQRIKDIVQTGGPMVGTESQMRLKTRNDFKILFDRASGIENKRKAYDDYVTTMKKIDYSFRRKSNYQPFEREFRSLFLQGKSRGGGSFVPGKVYKTVHVYDVDKGQIVTKQINATSEKDAANQLMKNYGMKDVNPDDLYFPKKGEKPSGVWAKGRQEANKFRVADAFYFKKNMSSLKQGKSMISGHIGYFNNTTMKNAFKYATGNTLTDDQVGKLDDAIIYGMVKGTTDDNMKTVFKSINSQIKKGVSFDTIVSNLKSKKTANAYLKYINKPKKVPPKKVNVARGGTKRKRVVSEAKKKGNSLIDGM